MLVKNLRDENFVYHYIVKITCKKESFFFFSNFASWKCNGLLEVIFHFNVVYIFRKRRKNRICVHEKITFLS